MEECGICCESFNKRGRKPVTCPGCQVAACQGCVQRYMLDEDNAADPHCMACKRPWLHEFLVNNLPKTSFLEGAYKKHRENVLFERERSFMPATQQAIERDMRLEELSKEIREHHARIAAIRGEIQGLERRQERLRRGLPEEQAGQDGEAAVRAAARAAPVFVRACPADGCRGFLGPKWRCGLCKVKVCRHCHEVVAAAPADQREQGAADQDGGEAEEEAPAGHTCNPDAVATARMLARDTKPCPNCASLIHKIDGCFARDTPILLWNGAIKMSQDIAVGDVLVGDDGEPRTVQELCSGEDELYTVTQSNGMAYTVNSRHKLVLKLPQEHASSILEITVHDYLQLPAVMRNSLKGYKSLAAGQATAAAAPARKRKHSCVDEQCDDWLCSSIAVEHVGRGRYWGWSVDGNHRFLLSDLTTTRNCDQMFCTQCHVAFSWRTGQVVRNGRIHNPHYYEFLRQQNNGVIPREPGDVAGGCQDNTIIPMVWDLDAAIRACSVNRVTTPNLQTFWNVHRLLVHVRDVELERFPLARPLDLNANMELRKQFMRGQITEAAFKARLQQREKKRSKDDEVNQVLTMLLQVAGERVRQVYTLARAERRASPLLAQLAEASNTFEQLRTYVNDNLLLIGKHYNNKVPQISEQWVVVSA